MRPGALQVPVASPCQVVSIRSRAVAGCVSAAGFIVLLLAGCGKPDPVAGLEELPAEIARGLRADVDLPVLATTLDPADPVPPPAEAPQALCPQDASKRRSCAGSATAPGTALLTIDRFCFGTCQPLNTLVVAGVPNNVSFVWWGAVENHPDGFEFVGEPVLKSTATQPCHPQDGGGGGGGGGGGHIP